MVSVMNNTMVLPVVGPEEMLISVPPLGKDRPPSCLPRGLAPRGLAGKGFSVFRGLLAGTGCGDPALLDQGGQGPWQDPCECGQPLWPEGGQLGRGHGKGRTRSSESPGEETLFSERYLDF